MTKVQEIRELLEEARKAIGGYLNRENADRIVMGLIKKHHLLLADDDLLSLVELYETEVVFCGYSFHLPRHEHAPDPFRHRLTCLAVERGKTSRTLEELEKPHHHSGETYIAYMLKDTEQLQNPCRPFPGTTLV